jgi:hypothetical protein
MALDLHFGESADSAAKSAPKLQIEYRIHDEIFGKLFYKNYKKQVTEYRLLERLADHYADAVFLCNELPSLIKELNLVVSKLVKNEQKELLNGLILLSNEAIDKKQNLYFFCD